MPTTPTLNHLLDSAWHDLTFFSSFPCSYFLTSAYNDDNISLDTCCQLLFFLKYHWIDQLSNLLTVQYFSDKHSQYYILLLICLKLHYSLFMFPRSHYLNYLTLPFNMGLFQYMGLLFQQWCWFLLLPPFTARFLLFWDLGQRVLWSCVKWNIFNIFLSYRKTIWLYPLYKQIP